MRESLTQDSVLTGNISKKTCINHLRDAVWATIFLSMSSHPKIAEKYLVLLEEAARKNRNRPKAFEMLLWSIVIGAVVIDSLLGWGETAHLHVGCVVAVIVFLTTLLAEMLAFMLFVPEPTPREEATYLLALSEEKRIKWLSGCSREFAELATLLEELTALENAAPHGAVNASPRNRLAWKADFLSAVTLCTLPMILSVGVACYFSTMSVGLSADSEFISGTALDI